MPASATIKKLPQGRTQATLVFDDAETKAAEEKALTAIGNRITVTGFRPGKAPLDMVRKQVSDGDLLERTVREALAGKLEEIVTTNNIRPILPPRIELAARSPLTVTLTFVERPTATLKGLDKIRIEKKEPKVEDKDVQRMVDYLLQEQRTFAEVDDAAKEGHQLTMDFVGSDPEGKEIPGTRAKGYPIVIGSKQLIPGFEEQLIGMKKGDSKRFTLTFPQDYHAEHLRGKQVAFAVTGTKVETVTTPVFDDAFVKKAQLGDSAEEVKGRMKLSMTQEEEGLERRRRESALFDALIKATQVDLPQELVEEEVRGLLEELAQGLERQNLTFDDWLARSKRKPEEVRKEMQAEAARRLTLRFGLEKAVEEKKIEVTDDDMKQVLDQVIRSAPPEQRKDLDVKLRPGTDDYERLRWRKMVETFVEVMLSA